MQGYVTHYNAEKEFGFIRTEAGDWFFRSKDVTGDVQRGDVVMFWLDDSRRGRGLVAVEVKRLDFRNSEVATIPRDLRLS
jgi:cold shock CspA family protein